MDQRHATVRSDTLKTLVPCSLLLISLEVAAPTDAIRVTRLVRKLNVSLLVSEQIDQAFPLVCASCPDANLEAWRRFAKNRIAPHLDRGTGILVVRNEQACIVGIGDFLLSHDLLHGPVLFTDQFCALDIVDQISVARALENGIEKIARRYGCMAVHTNVTTSGRHSDDGWLCSVLHERGHRVEALHMCKLIPGSG